MTVVITASGVIICREEILCGSCEPFRQASTRNEVNDKCYKKIGR